MKVLFAAVCLMLISVTQAPVVLAKELQEYRLEADQHYQQQDFKKAYKIYFKLAKSGDHYSQGKISQMYANGEGKKTDLTEAYAWSVLAAEGGAEGVKENSQLLLQQVDDKSLAEKKAAKLMKKYSEAALTARKEKYERMKANHKSGGCTGRRLGCS